MLNELRHFWVAAVTTGRTVIFGPYTFQDASDQRTALKLSLGGDRMVSTVFASPDRESAKANANCYLQ